MNYIANILQFLINQGLDASLHNSYIRIGYWKKIPPNILNKTTSFDDFSKWDGVLPMYQMGNGSGVMLNLGNVKDKK